MLELVQIKQGSINAKDRVTIELIRDGKDFLEDFNLSKPLILEAVAIIHKYLTKIKRIPHNLYKFFIAAYYIIERHPRAFPMHQSKKDFLERFGIDISTLEYCVSQIVTVLNYLKILDDKHYPYFIDPEKDIAFGLAKKVIFDKTEKVTMNFLLLNHTINTEILCEDLTNKLIFDMGIFPEELFRQFYEIFYEYMFECLNPYMEYIELQQRIFV